MEVNVQTLNKICRVCLIEHTSMQSLFTKIDEENRSLLEMLQFIANINVKIEDSLPKQVCGDCKALMCKADAFKRRCLESETILYRICKNAGSLAETSKTAEECSIKHENSDNKEIISNYDNFQALTASNYSGNDNLDSKNLIVQQPTLFLTIDGNFSKISGSEVPKNYGEQVKEELLNNFDEEMDFSDHYHEESVSETIPIKCKQENESKTYSCECGVTFTNKDNYKIHMKHKTCDKNKNVLEKNSKNKEIVCIDCDRKFNTTNSLKVHKRTCINSMVEKSELHECKHCLCNFKSAAILAAHIQKHENDLNSESELYQCSFCLRRFKNKTSLTAHLERHEKTDNIKHKCEVCKREFKYKAYLENHILTMHSRKNGLNCDTCGQSFPDANSLELHKESHKNEKKHRCSVCNKAFLMSCTLKEHMRTHTGEKPFLCSQCGKGFSQKTNLAQHMRRHQGLKPFKCENCEKRFVSKGELDAHGRKHSGAHPFVCDDCNNGFTTSSALVKHRRIHTGEKPYLCDLCPMRFAASGTLKNHRRTHTGERPFQCSYCEKAFVQRNDLISHIRCHTGEKPYICTQCGQSFRKASGLKTHVKMHGKESMLQGVMLNGLQVTQ